MRSSTRVIATGVAAAVLIGAVVVVRMLGKDLNPGLAMEQAERNPAVLASQPAQMPEESLAPIIPEGTAPSETGSSEEDAAETSGTGAAKDAPEETHYYNGLDPNEQPRQFMHIPFVGLSTVPDGYETTGDFHLAAGGMTLSPLTPGEEVRPRIAMIESPPLTLDFKSNAVNPLWKETAPDGTEVLVEVSLSQDGTRWTDWMPTTSAHYEGEMSPTYPDGRPNPNYGYTLGDMTFYGLTRFQYFRYAVTMYSETAEAPVVSDFRLFYQDSTMGDADLAQAAQTVEGGAAQ